MIWGIVEELSLHAGVTQSHFSVYGARIQNGQNANIDDSLYVLRAH